MPPIYRQTDTHTYTNMHKTCTLLNNAIHRGLRIYLSSKLLCLCIFLFRYIILLFVHVCALSPLFSARPFCVILKDKGLHSLVCSSILRNVYLNKILVWSCNFMLNEQGTSQYFIAKMSNLFILQQVVLAVCVNYIVCLAITDSTFYGLMMEST